MQRYGFFLYMQIFKAIFFLLFFRIITYQIINQNINLKTFFYPQQRNFSVKQLPFPISLLAEILPPCKFIICLHKLSPIPLPVGFVVKKGTKILSNTSGRMPLPLSQTERKNRCFSKSQCVLMITSG